MIAYLMIEDPRTRHDLDAPEAYLTASSRIGCIDLVLIGVL